MPKAKRKSALYQRGDYRLDWDRRDDGTLRSPFLTVFWYDSARGGGRSASTGTEDIEAAKTWLDAFYLGQTTGEAHCPTCGRQWDRTTGHLVTEAIANYLVGPAATKPSLGAIRARLSHVVAYIGTLPKKGVTCDQVDENWIAKFRAWMEKQPIVSPKAGDERKRSLSTIEGSVAQLSAAINAAYARGDSKGPPRFKIIPVRSLNRTPHHRSDVAELAAMFRYCVNPGLQGLGEIRAGRRKEPLSAPELRARRIRERGALHRFLIASVATLARPDAAQDVSTDPKRRQWNSKAAILDLNPSGRRQTKKYRAVVPIARQVSPHLDAAPAKAFFVGPASVRKAWEAMADELDLPDQGEGGLKLIRRSMADLVRSRLPEEAWGELSMFMGHDKFDSTTDLYAPFRPTYLRRALAAIEAIIDEIEEACPGAFRRKVAGPSATVVSLSSAK